MSSTRRWFLSTIPAAVVATAVPAAAAKPKREPTVWELHVAYGSASGHGTSSWVAYGSHDRPALHAPMLPRDAAITAFVGDVSSQDSGLAVADARAALCDKLVDAHVRGMYPVLTGIGGYFVLVTEDGWRLIR